MNVQQSSTSTLERPDVHSESETGLHGRWLFLAQAVWMTMTALIIGLNLIAVPSFYATARLVCAGGPTCHNGVQFSTAIQLTTDQADQVAVLGLSPSVAAAYQIALQLFCMLICTVLALLIFWRRSDDRMALFGSFTLVTFGGATFSIMTEVLAPRSLLWYLLVAFLYFLGQVCIVTFFLLFPSGRFVPRWTRWIALANAAWYAYALFRPPFAFTSTRPGGLEFLLVLPSVVIAQIYRYQRRSTPRERQQTKWVVFGVAIALLGFVGLLVLGNLFLPPTLGDSVWFGLFLGQPVINGFLLLIPLSIGVAILRSRLWDIDTLINKALVYGLLTGLLAGGYVGLVVGLESLIGLFARGASQQSIVLVVSTLVIAALFQPLRHRIQQIIDRRFYRKKYDATKTLAAFSATLRNEVDLQELREQLLAVVQGTMQPAHVSLWLRPPEQRRTYQNIEEGGAR